MNADVYRNYSRRAGLLRMKRIDVDGKPDVMNFFAHRARSKTVSFSLVLLQTFTLFRFADSCNPVAATSCSFSLCKFDVDFSCHPTASQLNPHDVSSSGMHLRGGTVSKEGYSRTEYSRASAVSFAQCARHSGRCPPSASDATFSHPLHPSAPKSELRYYHEGRATMRIQPPKLSRSVEIND